MGPYASPPFLGPLHAVLHIDYKQFATLPAGQQTYAVSLPALPLQTRLTGVSLGERFIGFSEPTPTTWTATVSLGSTQLLTSGVGVSNPAVLPLPAGQLPAHVYVGQRIGNQVFQLSIALLGPAQPATVTGTVTLTNGLAEGLDGETLEISTDDRGPLSVDFQFPPLLHPPGGLSEVFQVLNQILDVTNIDPAADLDPTGSYLILQSGRTDFSSTLTIVGGTALTALGLSTGTWAGTPSTPATVTGTQNLNAITYNSATGTLNGLTLILRTDDRGPFTVTFGTGASAPGGPSDVPAAISAATNTDPAVSLNASDQLVFTSANAGSAAFLKFSGSAALDLGLPHGRVYGTDGVAAPAPAVTGTVPLGSLTYGVSGGSLNFQVLTLTTDRGSFSLTFGTPSGPGDVLAAIQDVTNIDPAASLTSPLNQLVLTSGNAGLTASVTILGGTALAALGFSPGVTYGTGSGSTATKATVTGTVSLTPTAAVSLTGLSLSFQTDDRGPFTVTFGTPASANDVVAAFTAATNTDPVVSMDAGGHLVLQSQGTGTAATMTVGGAAAITLGLTTTATPTVTVTAPGLSTATAGEIDAHLFYYVDRG